MIQTEGEKLGHFFPSLSFQAQEHFFVWFNLIYVSNCDLMESSE